MSKEPETIEEVITFLENFVEASTIARINGRTMNNRKAHTDTIHQIQKIIERAKPAPKERTSPTEFTTWDRKTKIVKTWENESDPGFNKGIDEYEQALNNVLYGEKK